MAGQNAIAQEYVDQIPSQHSETHVSDSVPQQYFENNATRPESPASSSHVDGVNAKGALAPIAGAPIYDNTAASGPTLKDRTGAIVSSATEKANVIASNAAAQAHVVALNATVNAKQRVMANPTVQDTTEQVRGELFSRQS